MVVSFGCGARGSVPGAFVEKVGAGRCFSTSHWNLRTHRIGSYLSRSSDGHSVPSAPQGRPTVRVEGSTHPQLVLTIAFYSSPYLRTPGVMKGHQALSKEWRCTCPTRRAPRPAATMRRTTRISTGFASRRSGGSMSCALRTHPPNSPTRSSTLSLIHISEPTRLLSISYAVFCL